MGRKLVKESRRVVAIVVTYNRLAKLKDCLNCLLHQLVEIDVLVVDNASTDGTQVWVEQLMKEQSRLRYLRLGDNVGGAGGFAAGMAEVMEKEYSWLWLLDDDVMVRPDSLEKLLDRPEVSDPAVAVLASKVVLPDGSLAPMNRQARYAWQRGTLYAIEQAKLDGETFDCDSSSFVSFLIKAAVVRQVGLPRTDFFIHFDDVEYSLRLRQAGYRIVVVCGSIVTHAITVMAGTNGVVPVDQLWKHYYGRRNEIYMSLRMVRGWWNKIGYLFRRAVRLLWLTLSALRRDQPGRRIKVEWQAVYNGLRGKLGRMSA